MNESQRVGTAKFYFDFYILNFYHAYPEKS